MGDIIALGPMLGRILIGCGWAFVVWKAASFADGASFLETITIVLASAAAFAFSGALTPASGTPVTGVHSGATGWRGALARVGTELRAVLLRSPLARYLVTNSVGRLFVAIAFGIGVTVLNSWFAAFPLIAGMDDEWWRHTAALALASATAWTLVNLATGNRPTLIAELFHTTLDALGFEMRKGSRLGSAISSAVMRAAVTVALRAAMLGVLPLILENEDALWLAGGLVFVLVAGGSATVEFARRVDGLVSTPAGPRPSEEAER